MRKLLNTVAGHIKKLKDIRENYEKRKAKKKKTESFLSGKKKVEITEITISFSTLVKVLFSLALFWLLAQGVLLLQGVVVLVVISFFIAVGLTPVVAAFERARVPRPIAILLIYILFFGALAVLFAGIVPILARQSADIATEIQHFFQQYDVHNTSLPPFAQSVLDSFNLETGEFVDFIATNIGQISKNLQGIAGSTFGVLSGVFQGVFNFIFALVLIFFILMEREVIGRFFLALFPAKDRDYLNEKFQRIQMKIGLWVRGQVILMLSVGLGMYGGMKILEYIFGVQYAATIGLLAGFMELFPYIGVLVTGILACLIAINISWMALIGVFILIVLVQFLEGNVLVPIVMEKATGLPSVVVMLALTVAGVVGNAFGGPALAIICMILAIPVTASVSIFIEEYIKREDQEKS